jgi:ribosomal protein S18 acetylase RimI-like enzyme
MLEFARGLSPAQLDAVAELEARVVRHVGGRLKVEWGELRNRSPERVSDILWWDEDRLLGFLGIYQFGSSTPELAGMVDPEARRRGIGSALLDEALPRVRERGCHRALLVVPRGTLGGAELAARRDMEFDHSEHALTLTTPPPAGRGRPGISLRQATTEDIPELSRLFLDGFGSTDSDVDRPLNDQRSRTLLVTLAESVVGTIRLSHDGSRAGVYGFVIDHPHRGEGIGAEVLRRVCQQLFYEGARTVNLEVAVENERALGLYRRLGFEPVTTEDYYALALQ